MNLEVGTSAALAFSLLELSIGFVILEADGLLRREAVYRRVARCYSVGGVGCDVY